MCSRNSSVYKLCIVGFDFFNVVVRSSSRFLTWVHCNWIPYCKLQKTSRKHYLCSLIWNIHDSLPSFGKTLSSPVLQREHQVIKIMKFFIFQIWFPSRLASEKNAAFYRSDVPLSHGFDLILRQITERNIFFRNKVSDKIQCSSSSI
jgi:hypothetical protein